MPTIIVPMSGDAGVSCVEPGPTHNQPEVALEAPRKPGLTKSLSAGTTTTLPVADCNRMPVVAPTASELLPDCNEIWELAVFRADLRRILLFVVKVVMSPRPYPPVEESPIVAAAEAPDEFIFMVLFAVYAPPRLKDPLLPVVIVALPKEIRLVFRALVVKVPFVFAQDMSMFAIPRSMKTLPLLVRSDMVPLGAFPFSFSNPVVVMSNDSA